MPSTLLPAEWKKVLKDHKDAPETAPLTKAIEAYAKVEPKAKDDPQPVLDALEKVVDAAKSARSANARDKSRKPVVDFLDDVLKDAAAMKVKAERFLQEKKERDREGDDEDEGGDNERAKLTERLVKVKKLEVDAAKPFVLALGKKSHGLVIAKTPGLAADHKKRARAMREGSGKVFIGLVYGEAGKHVFQLDEKPPGGLAKAIKKTAKMHTDLLIRVILRGPGGFELDDETDAEELADLGTDDEQVTAEGTETESESETGPQTTPDGAVGEGLKQWQSAAQRARFQVRRLQTAIRLIEHTTSPEVVDLLDEVVEELETDPASRVEAETLLAYIRTDDVVARAEEPNPFGVEVKIREPLLTALERLRNELPA